MNPRSLPPRFFLTALGCMMLPFGASFATESCSDTLDLDVTFIGNREVLLQDAHKQLHWPTASPLKTAKPVFDYPTLSKRINVQPEWQRNGPVRLKVDDPLPRLYKGKASIGMGNFVSPYLDLSYADIRSRLKTWGSRLHHESSRGGYTASPREDVFSGTQVTLWGKRFKRDEVLGARIHLDRQRISYYGGNQPDSTDNTDSSMRYYTSGVSFQMHNNPSSPKADRHVLTFQYNLLWDDQSLTEHNFDLALDYDRYVEDIPVHLRVHSNIDRFQKLTEGSSFQSSRQAIFDFHPSISTHNKSFQTRIGLGLWIDAQGNKPFTIVPEAEFSMRLLRDLFVPYVQIDGGIQQNRYQSAVQQNPFLNALSDLKNTYQKLAARTGLRGSITRALAFDLGASYESLNQRLFWANDTLTSSGAQFIALYQDVNVTQLSGSLTWTREKKLTVTGSLSKAFYSLDTLSSWNQSAWNLPEWEAEIEVQYTWKEKVRLSSDFRLQTGRQGLQSLESEISVDLEPIAQWDARVEYLYNGRLSAWLQGSNLLNRSNPFLTTYDARDLCVILGGTYAF